MKLPKFLYLKHNQAIIALVIANSIWGAASPVFKLALENIPPFTLAFIRFFGASLILLPFCLKQLHNGHIPDNIPLPKRKHIFKILVLSICGITINITFFFYGLKFAPSINAPIIASASPLILYLFSIIVLKERAHKKILYGTLISLSGVLLVIGEPIITGKFNGELLGNLMFVLAMLGSVGHAIYCKEIAQYYRAIVVTFWSFIVGTVTFFPLFVEEIIRLNPFATLDYRGWLGIIFGVVLSSTLAYLLFGWAVKRLDTQEVGIFTYIDPLIATFIAIPLLGEQISGIFLIGSLLVFSGIFVAEGRLHWHPLHKFIAANAPGL